MISQKFTSEIDLKEYCNIPSLIFREMLSKSKIPSGAQKIWLLLFDLAKFDRKFEINITIKRLQQLLGYKSKRTVEMALKALEDFGLISRKANKDRIGKRLENTYILILDKLKGLLEISNRKMSVKPKNPINTIKNDVDFDYSVDENYTHEEGCLAESQHDSKPENIGDPDTHPAKKFGAYNYTEYSNINNCCNDYSSGNKEIVDNFVLPSGKNEKLECYFPAKQKPKSKAAATLRHMINQPVIFEKEVYDDLTSNQENVVNQIIGYLQAVKHISPAVSAAKEEFEWIKATLLRLETFSNCGKSFLHRINVVIKLIREGRFSKPFAERYKSREEFYAQQKAKGGATHKKDDRLSVEARANKEAIDQCENNIKKALAKFDEARNESDKNSWSELLKTYRDKLQELDCLNKRFQHT